MMPILLTVPENPPVMAPIVSAPVIPDSSPMTSAVASSEINALALTLRHRNKSTAIPIINTNSIGIIESPYFIDLCSSFFSSFFFILLKPWPHQGLDSSCLQDVKRMLTQLLTGINLTCFFHCNRAFSYVQLQSLAVTDLFAYALT